ncbi:MULTISPECIES: hypothetical protein [Bosea]|jgi:hypothetical protein|uniref:hypothetical protein n=1 Tax=Bosea TaxID=85413 RepID=UPI0021501370|nr:MULTISPECIES: hypothetical protein [Bosea]MCR4524489.1 hypothetical protein [Bosea sp. 47.2.35]MDR6831457.1 hypothetical protein [Bosea robiniae]MDR6898196.1 hypothetical protein [Bosea sp. BE109]MDR7141581.1 hypothetical protein [Bosea sp. BE168]MDR7178204.1 hypothetical protein [Bosea sp. BE271]
MRKFLTLAALGIGMVLAAPAMASQDLPASTARQLDKQDAEYTWSAAAERRHMIMRETQRQQRYGRGGYGYGPRHGYYGRGYGYGPRAYGPPPGHYRRYRGW